MGISQGDLKAIRKGIAATIRPRWHAAPPADLGQVSHGKLKADEWRSCFEFDIPVSLLRIETERIASGRQTDRYRAKLVHSTFLLATAIRWATSHRTSTKHIENYTKTMRDYLQTIKDLRPNQRFRPNHVNALLVGNYLRLYGPVRGWWMFPFERVIGDLQRSSTNYQLGEQCPLPTVAYGAYQNKGQMEKTMFAAFCAKSTMYAVIQRLSVLDEWKDSIAITERSFNGEKRGKYILETRTISETMRSYTPPSTAKKAAITKSKPLDDAIQAAMTKSEKDLQRELGFFHHPEQADFQERVTINKHEFTTYRTSENHGVIFFQEAGGISALVPGVVRAIFQVRHGSATHKFLAVHRYLAPTASLPDPFARYPEFGASLWSSETQKEVTIVPGSRKICHAIYRDWDYKIMVMKPLNRVSNINLDGSWLANLRSFPRTFNCSQLETKIDMGM
jgi:hypothetical protein